MKSTVEEIRRRFDSDVERFSNLDTGQSATVDAPLAMALVAKAAALCTPQCAASARCRLWSRQLHPQAARAASESGHHSDRSEPAHARKGGRANRQGDFGHRHDHSRRREGRLPASGKFDIILAAAVLAPPENGCRMARTFLRLSSRH